MLALTLLSIGNFDYGINSRNANYGKKANNAKKAKFQKIPKYPKSFTLVLKKFSRAIG